MMWCCSIIPNFEISGWPVAANCYTAVQHNSTLLINNPTAYKNFKAVFSRCMFWKKNFTEKKKAKNILVLKLSLTFFLVCRLVFREFTINMHASMFASLCFLRKYFFAGDSCLYVSAALAFENNASAVRPY